MKSCIQSALFVELPSLFSPQHDVYNEVAG